MATRDIFAARLRRQGISEEDVQRLKKDKEEAERLAQLTASANARGAAPLPPGKGGPAPAKAATSQAPAKVTKYRALEDYDGDVSFEKGATLFVVGEPDQNDMVQAVSGGRAGVVPFSKLAPITPELLEAERVQRDKDLQAAVQQEEEDLRKEMEAMKIRHAEEAAATPFHAGANTNPAEKSAELLAYEKKLEEQFETERQKSLTDDVQLLDEEVKLKAEAARIEAMLKALDD